MNTIQIYKQNKFKFKDLNDIDRLYGDKLKGDLYECACLEYCKKHYIGKPYLYGLFPRHIKKKYNMTTRDEGADIVIIDNEENITHLIQCKFKGLDSNEKKHELSLRDVRCFNMYCLHENTLLKDIPNRILITNANKRSFTRKSQIDKLKIIFNMTNILRGGDIFNEKNRLSEKKEPPKTEINETNNLIITEDYDNNTQSSENNLIYEKKEQERDVYSNTNPETKVENNYQLRTYQSRCVKQMVKLTNSRMKITIMCGCGKTMIMLMYMARYPKLKYLVACPTISLCNQFIKSFRWFFKTKSKISRNFDGGRLLPEAKLTVTTYIGSPKLTKSQFDVCLFDEAHNTAVGKKNAPSRFLLENKNIQIKSRFFFTATEKIYGDGEFDMTNEQIYGVKLDSFTYQRGIEEGYVCPANIIGVIYSKISDEKLEEKINAKVDKISRHASIVLEYASKKSNTHTLTFHGTNMEAKEMAGALNKLKTNIDMNKLDVYRIYGEMKSSDRQEVMKKFQSSKFGVLCSVKTIGEGIDMPYVDSIMFCNPSRSYISIVQRACRGNRLFSGKQSYDIILPINILDINDKKSNKYKFLQNILFNLCKLHGSNELRFHLKDKLNKNQKNKAKEMIDLTRIELFDVVLGKVTKTTCSKFAKFCRINNRIPEKADGHGLYEYLKNLEKRFKKMGDINKTLSEIPCVLQYFIEFNSYMGMDAKALEFCEKFKKMPGKEIGRYKGVGPYISRQYKIKWRYEKIFPQSYIFHNQILRNDFNRYCDEKNSEDGLLRPDWSKLN